VVGEEVAHCREPAGLIFERDAELALEVDVHAQVSIAISR
jgi:hypothetical protein